MMIQHNQEIAQLSPDPFPLLRAGSGDKTNAYADVHITHTYANFKPAHRPVFIMLEETLSIQGRDILKTPGIKYPRKFYPGGIE